MHLLKKILLCTCLTGCFFACQTPLQKSQGQALGTTYHIIYQADKEYSFDAIFDTINASMSTYSDSSIITKINMGNTTIPVDTYFETVFKKSKSVWKTTNGLFDPTIGNLVDAWGFWKKDNYTPLSEKTIDSLIKLTGLEKVRLTSEKHIQKQHPNIKLDFSALAKGYTVDLIGQFLERHNVNNYLVEIGGEITVKGENSDSKNPWTVGIDHPKNDLSNRTLISKVILKNEAIATSGNYRKFFTDTFGRKYTHIINPKTGQPQQSNILSASIIAKDCMTADAFATATMLIPIDAISDLAKRENFDYYIVWSDEKGDLRTTISDGFKKRLVD